ncbi:hypothetical protein G9A89_015558 [Geosiphon pyriformis]|nr:hypothetical protein G9A89_015558 [Geosiphon pyriformis]
MPGRMLFIYTREEVAKHNTPTDLWVINQNKVYDMTEFVLDHPGGADLIEKWAGKDVTSVMLDADQHEHSQVAYDVLAELCIGKLVESTTNINFDDSTATSHLQHPLKHYTNPEDPSISAESNDFFLNSRSVETFHPLNTDIKSDLKKEKFLDLNRPLFYQMFNCKFDKEFYLNQVHQPRHLPNSARLFENPYLEMLTKTPWYVIPTIWLPGVCYHIYLASGTLGKMTIALLFFIGIGFWTLLEYSLHRFLFHVDQLLPDHPYALSLHFGLHGIHHYLPMDRLRLVMPPVLGVCIAIPIIRLGYIIFPAYVAQGIIAGAMFGYICYDMTHYYLHHARPFGEHLREMKTYHLAHHYKNSEAGYGITSKFWDHIFGTELQPGLGKVE